MANPPKVNNAAGVPVVAKDTNQAANVGVAYVRPELFSKLPAMQKVRDCLAGEETIKAKGATYLAWPVPYEVDSSPANQNRYAAYLLGAVFYNVAERTLAGLIGQVFLVEPVIEVPDLLKVLIKDANGSGVSLVQLAQQAEEDVTALGRGGLFTDYPETNGPVSRADQQNGKIRPTINYYAPEQIINWRTVQREGKSVLSLVVLSEAHENTDDPFEIEYERQFRVLRLENDIYTQEIWRGKDGDYKVVGNKKTPKDSRGQPWRDIPFTFIGSVDNTPSVDYMPMYAICALNLAHYRNSANYEETLFMVGQATPVFTGLTEEWVDTVLGGKVLLGSRAAIPLPVGGQASLLQQTSDDQNLKGMEHKERQMMALGAKLVEQKQVTRTATEAGQDKASEDSILTTITKNVSAAFTYALEWAAIFAGATTVAADATSEAIKFELNTEFDIPVMGPDQGNPFISAWEKGAIDYEEMRAGLKKTGMATKNDEEARLAVEKARQADADFEAAQAAKLGGLPAFGA